MPITLNNTSITGLGVGGLPSGVVNAATLASSAVTAAKLASNAVTTANITDGNVTAAKLENGAPSQALRRQRFNIIGNVAANTWITLTNTGLFGINGIGYISGFSNAAGFGGQHFDVVVSVGTVPLRNRTTNDDYVAGLPTPIYAGHAANAQTYSFRLRFRGGNPSPPLIEFQTNFALSGLTTGNLFFDVTELIRN